LQEWIVSLRVNRSGAGDDVRAQERMARRRSRQQAAASNKSKHASEIDLGLTQVR
jgi:hypothetical protein